MFNKTSQTQIENTSDKKGSIVPVLIIFALYLWWILIAVINRNKEDPFMENWRLYSTEIHFLVVVIIGLIILYFIEVIYEYWNNYGIWGKVLELFIAYLIISIMIFLSYLFFGIDDKYLNTDIEGTIFMAIIPMLVINSAIIIIGGLICWIVSKISNLIKRPSHKLKGDNIKIE